MSRQQSASAPGTTATVTYVASSSSDSQPALIGSSSGTLRLRAPAQVDASEEQPRNANSRIRWAENVIDNEGLGRKSSKVCCIYHRNREVGESSEEDSSDSSDSDSDFESGDQDNSAARPSRQMASDHPSRGENVAHPTHNTTASGKRRSNKRSPNAYEKMPHNR